ncbi:hypothetical protein [Anderseniella sp. Alg231-50]|uniref:hypothetical protein n=1 Tax=Anderseniella sp. Alg231-50 TaxID=1922226 RepID=UPI00307C9080
MRRTFAASVILLASAQPGLADACKEKFTQLLIKGNDGQPAIIHITSEPKGGKVSKNDFFFRTTGHWMTVMTDPANQPISLAFNNKLFTSSDEGKSWKKVRDMDSEKNRLDNLKNQEANAKTVKKATCDEEMLDDVMHDTVEADFDTVGQYKSSNHYKYWVNRKTGWISKVTYESKSSGYESFTTQLLKKAPDLKLPMPD